MKRIFGFAPGLVSGVVAAARLSPLEDIQGSCMDIATSDVIATAPRAGRGKTGAMCRI